MATTLMVVMPPSHVLRKLRRITATNPFLRKIQKLKHHSLASLSPSFAQVYTQQHQTQLVENSNTSGDNSTSNNTKSSTGGYFPKRGQTLELVCESLAFKGKGMCKVADTGFVVMCDRALPGERFIGRVTRRKGTYAEVTKVKTISPHWDLVDAPCEYAPYCGGCKTQNLSYEAQIRAKEHQVRELIIHVGKFSDEVTEFFSIMKHIVPCDIQFHYRNKMEFSFGSQKWLPRELLGEEQDGKENYALGLHAPGFFDKVLNVNKCLLQSEPANTVLAAIQDCWRDSQFGLTLSDVTLHTGFLKHLMLRTGRNAKTNLLEVMVNFVTSFYKPELLKPLVEKISAIPEVAEVLYKLIEDYAGLRGDGSEIVLYLFCGTGTIGLTLARRAKHVYGYEVVPQAISDAHRNAEQSRISNATFVQGDLNKIGEKFGHNFPKPDVVITDPNRPGMHIKLIKFLLKLKAPRIVYVWFNPATCARDLDYLCHGLKERNIEGCYQLISLQPVDMFPRTPHIECVCLSELCC